MTTAHEPHRFSCRALWISGGGATTSYESYSREFEVRVSGKPPLRGSSAPAFRGDGSRWNPEDMLLAALSSCHMLSYLALAARARVAVEAYEDDASGIMERAGGTIRFTQVTLRPKVKIAKGGDIERAAALHAEAHRQCFIASSVNFPVTNEPTVAT